jgi:hypothetical protein
MSAELFDHIAQFVKEVGGPTAVSFGLMAILWKQTGILKGIQESLDRLHDAVTGRKDSPFDDKVPPSLRAPRPARSHQG